MVRLKKSEIQGPEAVSKIKIEDHTSENKEEDKQLIQDPPIHQK